MKILGIGWLGLVSDRPETRQFYAKVLELKLIAEEPTYAYYIVNETTHLEILSTRSRLANRHRESALAIGFLVDDLDSAIQQLIAAGAKVRGEIEEWRSDEERHRWIYFEDPEGHTLLLLERHQKGE